MPARHEFDEQGYLDLYPDLALGVARGVIESGWQHFTAHGFREGRQWIAQPDPLDGVCREIFPGDEMFLGNPDHYFEVGMSALHCVETALFAARRQKACIKSILDLPCGHGRVMRFLKKAFPEARLTACDLNQSGVDFCVRMFGARPVLSRKEPAVIPLGDSFDLIWCGSLLTHLPEDKWTEFVHFFHRLLRPGGILLFTTHGRQCEADLASGRNRYTLDDRQTAELIRQYRERGFGYVDYTGESDYGISLTKPSYIIANFALQPEWELLGFHESRWDGRQDVFCLQRALVPHSPNPPLIPAVKAGENGRTLRGVGGVGG